MSVFVEFQSSSQFSTLLAIAQDILLALNGESKSSFVLGNHFFHPGSLLTSLASFFLDEVSIERMWVLYLVLKAILSNLKVWKFFTKIPVNYTSLHLNPSFSHREVKLQNYAMI